MKKPLPPGDEAAVAELVEQQIKEREDEEERQFALLDWSTHPGVLFSEICAQREREVVEEAKRGNVAPLAEWIRGRLAPMAPATRALIAEFLTGARNLGNGKPKGTRGAPKKTEEERRSLNPIHDANDQVPIIQGILREFYPDQTSSHLRDRALSFAASRKGVRSRQKGNETETLKYHRNRSRKDHRRI